MTKVAFVGLGNMGWPMAANLVRAGFRVTGIDAERARAESWASAHDTPAAPTSFATSITAVADAVDVVVTMLPSGVEVREVLLAAAADAQDGQVAIDMSSADPVGTRELGAELAAWGVRLIDAPVSGGVPRAVAGTLAIMVGGEPDAVDTARPILSAMGDRLFEVGGLGNGHAMKCLNNFVAGTAFVACSEALAVGERFGLDPSTMFDVMNVSTARCFNTEMVMKQQVVAGEFASGFALGLLAKDVGIADSLAAAMGADTPLADLVTTRLAEARDALGFAVDHTRAHQHWTRQGQLPSDQASVQGAR
jgi:3-hydroxyisobutyrate dehydrogenase